MKKLFLAICVCAGLCACSSDDDLIGSTSTSDLDGSVAYLKVNIKDVNSSTRATDGGFAYGTSDEQTINNAYFYFYGSDGHAMAKGSITGGVSGTAKESGTEADGNIEWNSDVVVAVWGLDGEHLPTQMLTVLNQPSGIDLSGLSLEQATAVLAGTPWGDATNGFVMTTSVYENSTTSPIIHNTTALVTNNFAPEPIDVIGDYTNGNYTAAEVYVERLAAKVSVTDAVEEEEVTVDGSTYTATNITNNLDFEIASSAIKGLAVRLVGWDINGTARDAYLSKQVNSNWSSNAPFTSWNETQNNRCYWAESPNYGDSETVYPTSSNGNTDTDEKDASTWLNEYLKYTSLYTANDFTSSTTTPYAYCGENTNTTTVLEDETSTGITNLLVKAQALASDGTDWHASDLVEYAGHIYTAADFCQKCVDDVVAYDFTVLVDDVIAGLETSAPALAPYLDELNAAIYHDGIWVGEAVTDHKVTSSNVSSSVSLFDGSMLSLYNAIDGNVRMFYNGAQPYYGSDGTGSQVDPDLYAKYPSTDIVYPATNPADMDDYEFYFHIDESKIEDISSLARILNLIVTIGEETYLPIDNSFYFTSTKWDPDDSAHGGNHVYTLRNYFLRAITTEADDIDADFGSHYPNLYTNGYMYYNVPIEHLASAPTSGIAEGQYGIVRNHWYDITINSITGLGRGIADLNEVIIPQPEVTYYYLGADINILSWKMVNQTVNW